MTSYTSPASEAESGSLLTSAAPVRSASASLWLFGVSSAAIGISDWVVNGNASDCVNLAVADRFTVAETRRVPIVALLAREEAEEQLGSRVPAEVFPVVSRESIADERCRVAGTVKTSHEVEEPANRRARAATIQTSIAAPLLAQEPSRLRPRETGPTRHPGPSPSTVPAGFTSPSTAVPP